MSLRHYLSLSPHPEHHRPGLSEAIRELLSTRSRSPVEDWASLDQHGHRFVCFAEEVLDAVERLPGEAGSSGLTAPMSCALELVGDHWGVYGAAVAGPSDPRWGMAFRPALLVDPAWLDRDFRRLRSTTPRVVARHARWAVDALHSFLDLEIPKDAVLHAVLPPRPFSATSGDLSYWPSKAPSPGAAVSEGTLGPPVRYDDNGTPAAGFLTAGHAAPEDLTTNPSAALDVEDGSGAIAAETIKMTHVPRGIGVGLGRQLLGEIDAAIVATNLPPTTGVGKAGGATHDAEVIRVGRGNPPKGWVTSYVFWVGGTTGLWANCYAVQLEDADFAAPGDSGAAVTAGGDVIGIVVAGAACVPGCKASISYVQDIDAIKTAFSCDVIP